MFVRQLAVAGISEIDGQLRAFFNADLLARDVESRAVVEEVAAISELDSMLLSGWEDAYADPVTAPNGSQYEVSARGLYVNVMARAERVTAPPELPIRAIHARGFMHRIVEDGRAGWVHDWRAVADDHRSALPGTDTAEETA